MSADQLLYNPCVLYSLPKDVTTQAIGEKSIECSLQKVRDFLSLFSDVSDIEFNILVAHIPQPSDRHYEIGLQKIGEARALFGLGIESTIGYHYPSGKPLLQRKIEWEFQPADTAAYLNFIIGQQPIPAFELPLLEIIGGVYFHLVDKQGNKLLSQTCQSSLTIWLGRNSAISPTIWLPFTELNEEFLMYKNWFADKFPGKFNTKYLRRIKPTKGGSSYQVRKI